MSRFYGKQDILKSIQIIKGPDIKASSEAFEDLSRHLVHQGSRYEESVYAVPHLVRLLEENIELDKSKIIQLLVHIAIGFDDEYLPNGINPKYLRNQVNDIEFACYNAVQKEVHSFIHCLANTNKDVRMLAGYALAWFPDESEKSIPSLQIQLANESELFPTAVSLISIGMLAKNSSYNIDILNSLDPYLWSSSAIIRSAAAIAIAINRNKLEDKVITSLVDASIPGAHILGSRFIPYYEGRYFDLTALVLNQCTPEAKRFAISTLCQKYEQDELMSFEPMYVNRLIVSLLADDELHQVLKKNSAELTPLQKRALEIYADFGRKKRDRFSEISYQYGLPITPEELDDLLHLSDY